MGRPSPGPILTHTAEDAQLQQKAKRIVLWGVLLPGAILVILVGSTLVLGNPSWHPTIADVQRWMRGPYDDGGFPDGEYDLIELRKEGGVVIEKHNKTRRLMWRWIHDKKNRLVNEVMPNGRERRWVYDERDRLSEARIDGMGYLRLYYDKGGSVRAVVKSAGDEKVITSMKDLQLWWPHQIDEQGRRRIVKAPDLQLQQ